MHCLFTHTSFSFMNFTSQLLKVLFGSFSNLRGHSREYHNACAFGIPSFILSAAKPIPNNGYVCGPWGFPHLFIVSVLPHGAFASFHTYWSLIVCSMLDLNCNSNSTNLGSILLQSALASGGARDAKSPSTNPAGWRNSKTASPQVTYLAVSQGTGRERASLTSASPAIQNAAYPGSSYPEKEGSSAPSLSNSQK